MENKNMVLANRLSKAMAYRKVYQYELSKITGITPVSISRYLSGIRFPRGTEIIKISNALNVSSDYLLGLDDVMTRNKEEVVPIVKLVEMCKDTADKYEREQRELIRKKNSLADLLEATIKEACFRVDVPEMIGKVYKEN